MPDHRLLLDTHCWIWMALGEQNRLTAAGVRAVEEAAAPA